jgi:ribosomal protein S18 acetylase RimI-like enzyme
VHVRGLTRTDAAAFRELRLRALKEHAEAFTSSFEEDVQQPITVSEQRLAGESGHRFWGAFVADGLQGMIGLNRESRIKSRHKGNVVAMYVAPEFARQGLGRALLQAVIAHARDVDGLEQLVLTVTHANTSACELYMSAGFTSFGVEPRAIQIAGKYFDKEHMILFL